MAPAGQGGRLHYRRLNGHEAAIRFRKTWLEEDGRRFAGS
jgi:hypothetical protein